MGGGGTGQVSTAKKDVSLIHVGGGIFQCGGVRMRENKVDSAARNPRPTHSVVQVSPKNRGSRYFKMLLLVFSSQILWVNYEY